MSSFVKHPQCEMDCMGSYYGYQCVKRCGWLAAEEDEPRPIFEQRDTDEEARLDRKARARECK